MAATTAVVGTTPVTGKKADLIQAVHTAAEAAHRLAKPGKKVKQIQRLI
jgi:methionine aminopeptidase